MGNKQNKADPKNVTKAEKELINNNLLKELDNEYNKVINKIKNSLEEIDTTNSRLNNKLSLVFSDMRENLILLKDSYFHNQQIAKEKKEKSPNFQEVYKNYKQSIENDSKIFNFYSKKAETFSNVVDDIFKIVEKAKLDNKYWNGSENDSNEIYDKDDEKQEKEKEKDKEREKEIIIYKKIIKNRNNLNLNEESFLGNKRNNQDKNQYSEEKNKKIKLDFSDIIENNNNFDLIPEDPIFSEIRNFFPDFKYPINSDFLNKLMKFKFDETENQQYCLINDEKNSYLKFTLIPNKNNIDDLKNSNILTTLIKFIDNVFNKYSWYFDQKENKLVFGGELKDFVEFSFVKTELLESEKFEEIQIEIFHFMEYLLSDIYTNTKGEIKGSNISNEELCLYDNMLCDYESIKVKYLQKKSK